MATMNEPITAKRPEGISPQATRPAIDRIGTQAKEIGEDLQELGGTAVEALQDKFGELRSTASEYYEQGKDRFSDAEHSVEKFMRQHPLKTILIAAGAGWLLGRFWVRR